VLALRIGTVKNSKNFLRVVGPARAMSAGAEKESTETTASSESDVDLYLNRRLRSQGVHDLNTVIYCTVGKAGEDSSRRSMGFRY
jgi:hypothetical protein